jgi:hypothetical protein
MKTLYCALAVLALPVWMNGEDLTVTHTAHAGFLLEGGGKKVLVDALTLPSGRWKYEAPSKEMRTKMEQGQPPFDNIDVLLVSHAHSDHFGPPLVVNFLIHNPKAVLLTTSEVRDLLQKWIPDFPKVASRVVVPPLEWKQSVVQEINGVRIEVARLKHGDEEWPCIVYAFLFDLGGKRVLYASGAGVHFPEEYRELGWAKRGIDLAFFSAGEFIFQFAQDRAELNLPGIEVERELIAAKTPVATHIRPDQLPLIEGLMPQLRKRLPKVVFFNPLEKRTF